MPKVDDSDKNLFVAVYKKLEEIKKELKHSHSLDIVQSIIIRYEQVNIHSESIVRHTAADHKDQKKLNKIEERIDQLIFEALYKELERMKHELKHCSNFESLSALQQHYHKINTNTDAVIRHITKHPSAQTKIIKIEKGIMDQINKKKEELAPLEQNDELETLTITIEPIENRVGEDTIELHNGHDMEQQDKIGNVSVEIELEKKSIVTHDTSSPHKVLSQEHSAPVQVTSSASPSTSQKIIMDSKQGNKTDEGLNKLVPAPFQQKKERELRLNKFDSLVKKLQDKRDEFHIRYPQDRCDDSTKPYGALSQLIKKLNSQAQSYKEGTLKLEEFKEQSSKLIKEQRQGVLSKHRGCKELLANLLLAIGTLGIGYALAALFTKSFSPIKLNTNTATQLDETLCAVEECGQPVMLKV